MTKTPREFYIPAGATKVADKQSDAVAYLYADRQSRLCARVFYGRKSKPVATYYFPTTAAREDVVTRLFESRRKVAERKTASKTFRHAFRSGDIFRCSWGYDQTNVDYYECTALIGDTMLEVRRIDSAVSDGDGWTGTRTPLPGQFSAGVEPDARPCAGRRFPCQQLLMGAVYRAENGRRRVDVWRGRLDGLRIGGCYHDR